MSDPERLGRADLHVHTVASDGTADVVAILDHVGRLGDLDVVAITDHERIDAAQAAQAMAVDQGRPFEVVVGEEVTTLGGHLLALYLERPVKPYRSLRTTILDIHDAGGLAIPAHPLVPYPLCAQGWVLRRLLDDPEAGARPDALETFNPTALGRPWHDRVVRFADRSRTARGGQQRCPCPGRHRQRLDGVRGPDRGRPAPRPSRPGRRPPAARSTARPASSACSDSSCASAPSTPATRSAAASVATARDATTAIPAAVPARPATTRVRGEDRPRLPVHLPRERGRRPARPVPVREPPAAWPRRARHHRQPRPAALVGGRHHPPGRRLLGAHQRVGRDAHLLAPLPDPDRRPARARALRRPALPRAVRALPVALPAARVDERQRRHLPRLCRLLAVVRVRQPGPAGPRRSAPRPDRRERRGPPLHRPLLPGRLQGHPQRRRRRRAMPTPCRWRAGRTARRTSCSSGATSRARACSTCSRPTASCARPARSIACSSSARGPRSARRAATWPRAACRASSSWAGSRTPRRPSSSGPPTVYASPATGGESFGIVLLEAMAAGTAIVCSDIHGYKGVVRRGREALLVPPREPRALAVAIDRLLRDAGPARADGRRRPGPRRGVQLVAGDRQGRRLLRVRHPPRGGQRHAPAGFRAEIPQAPPPLRARPSAEPSAEPSTGAGAFAAIADSASASRHTEAE